MKTRNFLLTSLPAGLTLLVAATTLLARDDSTIPQREATVPWLAILYGLVCLAGVCAVAFKHSRRTHLD